MNGHIRHASSRVFSVDIRMTNISNSSWFCRRFSSISNSGRYPAFFVRIQTLSRDLIRLKPVLIVCEPSVTLGNLVLTERIRTFSDEA